MNPLINPQEFKNKFDRDGDVILMDARPKRETYLKSHIVGAYHLDLETELSNPSKNPSHGGRHPLPSPKKFSNLLSSMGVNANAHIIVYDENNTAFAAARLWWMLRAAGLKKVQVLDGGLDALREFNMPMDHIAVEKDKSSAYSFDAWQLPLVDIDEVDQISQSKNYCIIDVRDTARYLGETEPIDKIAGHIPSAINIPFKENLNQDRTFLSPAELRQKYQAIFEKHATQDIIVHCGSGVTACHTLLAMHVAGFEMPNLYVGSWSEWSRNQKPVATGEN